VLVQGNNGYVNTHNITLIRTSPILSDIQRCDANSKLRLQYFPFPSYKINKTNMTFIPEPFAAATLGQKETYIRGVSAKQRYKGLKHVQHF